MIVNLSGVGAAEIAAQQVIVQQAKIALDLAQRNPLNQLGINRVKENYGRENAKLIQLKVQKRLDDQAAVADPGIVKENILKNPAVMVAGVSVLAAAITFFRKRKK